MYGISLLFQLCIKQSHAGMRYCEISKEMSSLYLRPAVLFCSAYLRLESQNLTHNPSPPYSVHCTLYTASNYGALASNWQNTSSPKYNDDISLLISQYLISSSMRLVLLMLLMDSNSPLWISLMLQLWIRLTKGARPNVVINGHPSL